MSGKKGLGALTDALFLKSGVANFTFGWIGAIVVVGLLLVVGNNFAPDTIPSPFAILGFSTVQTDADLNPPQGLDVSPSDCVLSTTQTLGITSYDADKNTALTATTVVYLDPASGALNPSSNNTEPFGTYYVHNTVSNYFGAVKQVTTGCQASPPVPINQKAVDTAVVTAVYNTDDRTLNNATDQNLSIGTGGTGTAHIKLSQSANYKHLGGVNGKFSVFLNATNMTDWDASQMSATFDNMACTAYTSYNYGGSLRTPPQPSALTGTMVRAWNCEGDFLSSDGGVHDLAVKYQASSGVNPSIQSTRVCFVGQDYYANTITNALEIGAVKDSGSAVQALQCAEVWIG